MKIRILKAFISSVIRAHKGQVIEVSQHVGVPLLRAGIAELIEEPVKVNTPEDKQQWLTREKPIEVNTAKDKHQWLTRKEIALKLNVTPQTVSRWAKQGEIEKQGKLYLFKNK